MKNCLNCKYADWRKTASGKMHPSGDGHCTFQWKSPPLPASMYWLVQPSPYGGQINRREELKDHCTYYARKP